MAAAPAPKFIRRVGFQSAMTGMTLSQDPFGVGMKVLHQSAAHLLVSNLSDGRGSGMPPDRNVPGPRVISLQVKVADIRDGSAHAQEFAVRACMQCHCWTDRC